MILGDVLQHAYVTTNVDEACQVLARQYGITKFYRPDVQQMTLDDGRQLTVHNAHAFVGSNWLEIIQPIAGDVALYRDWLPSGGGFALRFHHTGIRIPSEADLEAKLAEAKASGLNIVLSISVGDIKVRYIDTSKALGHYIECLYFPDLAKSPIPLIPQNIAGFPKPS
jgi:hypothetical protein